MKYDLSFRTPLMNAAGSLGFFPDPDGPVELARLGAFVTNPISLGARSPAQRPRCLPFPGGFLLHTGYPNPGLKAVLRRGAESWARSPLPVLVHLLVQRLEEIPTVLSRLEGFEGVAGVELGLPAGADAGIVLRAAAASGGELPVVLRLPLDRAAGLAPEISRGLVGSERVAALSLGPPRGALTTPEGSLIHGRLYGPALFPLALEAVRTVASAGLPVIAGCGVYTQAQADDLLRAGALAVQLDSVLWRGGFFS